MSDHDAPEVEVNPSSPLYGFDISAPDIPHGSTSVPDQTSEEASQSTAQPGSTTDNIEEPSIGIIGDEHGASKRPPTVNEQSELHQGQASPGYTAYDPPPQQETVVPPRDPAHDQQQPNGKVQMSPLQFPGYDQPNMAGHPQHPPWYPQGQGQWFPGHHQSYAQYQVPFMGYTQGGPATNEVSGLHPSQTDTAISILAQRAVVGDHTAQRIMADHWERQAHKSEGGNVSGPTW